MQIVDNEYYRCYKWFYYISLDKPVQTSFSLNNGQPIKQNDILGKIKTGDYFVSPYTTWKISLTPSNNNVNEFAKLRRYQNEFKEIVLEGHGQ